MSKPENLFSKIQGSARDLLNRALLLPQVKDQAVLDRFNGIRKDYLKLRDTLSGTAAPKGYAQNPGYGWNSWTDKIRNTFSAGVPLGFLSTPIIASTMVVGRKRGKTQADERIALVSEVFGCETAASLLREDFPGKPNITDAVWLTSANRAHQAYHLALYKKVSGSDIASVPVVLEWGAGYGNMARLVKRLNPGATYIIIDLPELLALQYVYLYSILGASALNPVCGASAIVEGKINFVPYSAVIGKKVRLECSGFISTWAITESPFEAQELVIDTKCFNAGKVLVAYAKGDGNRFEARLPGLGLKEEPAVLQPGHIYAFK